MQQQRNLLAFFLVAALILIASVQLRQYWAPPAPPQQAANNNPPAKDKDPAKPHAEVKLPAPPIATTEAGLLELGDASDESKYHLHVRLDPLGAGVRGITLNKFRSADDNGRPIDKLLELVPDEPNRIEPSYLLYHAAPNAEPGDRVLDTLGKRRWTVVGKGVTTDSDEEGKARQSLAFTTTIDKVVVTKTYTLTEGEYHLGLKIDLSRPKGEEKAKSDRIAFRYQLTGAKGLPVEGKWYTGTFRNAMIGTADERNNFERELQELRQIGLSAGGNPVASGGGRTVRYAGVVVQYFASMIAVDDRQEKRDFVRSVRPTLETAVAKGKIKAGGLGKDRITITSEDGKREHTFFLDAALKQVVAEGELSEGQIIAVVYRSLSQDDDIEAKVCPHLALSIRTGMGAEATHAMWEDDITVRLNSETVSLEPGQTVSHSYVLYNGPIKPRLLRGVSGSKEHVDEAVITRYSETLGLSTLSDYPSQGWLSGFFYYIGGTRLVITCTNVMHWVLDRMRFVIPNYGVCIILLTLLVRGMMFPVSRKQALMGVKMQRLQPELKELKKKFKDDNAGFGQAQMALFRQHGVNPFGSCWLLFLQMPVFMGLYFALQESITFRLAPFWPTWIANLAAPDMMFEWGRHIPLISRDSDYGNLTYLGPYFNLLPLIAVSLMIVQQKMMTPPAVDQEQEMQQKMMRIMMLVFGIFFYKIAAGLCIYIITSTIWGFAERKLLPKAQKTGEGGKTLEFVPQTQAAAAIHNPGATGILGAQANGQGRRPGKGKREKGKVGGVKAKDDKPKGLRERWADWWNEVLEQARKK